MPNKKGRKPHKNVIRPQTYSENINTITTTIINDNKRNIKTNLKEKKKNTRSQLINK